MFVLPAIIIWDTDWWHTLQPVCLELLLCMPKSVNIGHIHLNTEICHMCVVGYSPLVNLVISGTDWCWCTDTDKELHLSFTDGVNTWHACNILCWTSCLILTMYDPYN